MPTDRSMNTVNQFGLSQQTVEKIHSILNKFQKLKRAVLYGSRAKGNFRNGSDIDLTLIGDELSQIDLGEIENLIDDLNLPYSFDISIFNHIENQELVQHIERVGKDFFIRKI